MSSKFTPCGTCARHVKQGDAACPFCGAATRKAAPPAALSAAGRLSRSALFAAGAVGAALATTDCTSASPQPAYGGVVTPASDAASGSSSGGVTDGSSTTPVDSGGGGTPSEGGSVQPLYGAVAPPVDASPGGRFEGGAMALYGAAPVGT
jgi:hypothetical protein